MPRGVVIAITPSRKMAEDLEDTGSEVESLAAVEDASGKNECVGTVRIEEQKHEHDGEIAHFVIPKGSGGLISCCKKQNGDPLEVDNFRVKDGKLFVDVIDCNPRH